MKSKAKPAKGSARTKRFDVGGTVGALAGLGTLAYLMSRKKKGEAESPDVAARRASGAYRGGAGTDTTADTTTTTDTTTAKDTAQDEKARMESSLDTYRKITSGGGGSSDSESDTTPVSTNDNKPVVKKVVKKKPVVKKVVSKNVVPKKDDDKKVSTDKAPVHTGTGMSGSDRGAPPVPTLKGGESKVVGEGDLKPYPEAEAKARKAADRQKFLQRRFTTPGEDKNRQERSKGRSANPIQETIDNAGKSMARTREQQIRDNTRAMAKRKEDEKAQKLGYGIKKGGMVKKYASGGSVSSASRRADGIAQRGKTRGKVY